ncbi:MAG: alpha-amylase [Gracilimonas sp.]|uniref:alpha-amylase family glycosyl hydrolase n=1 Tax=Gracilimonas sp. TaxID=1974203 RepID=UPI00199099D3|nr:alpha-amylase family glycosyl hydrolase [Gracilimonas sp.]MBD3615939.1 alpha-amylase [Gracilimonas sp.]
MYKLSKIFLAAFTVTALFFSSCSAPEVEDKKPVGNVEHPEWSKNANIYEVNIRQYSEEGTFTAFREDLPRLQEMGVKILWLMPIHPIGEKNRKGELGSYYSVKDYKGINPNYGTEEDFRALVDEAHEREMRVIIDWVANHTAWDHPWTENPDWYELNEDGGFMPPRGTDWTDVIQLDYENQEMREAMLDALVYWVRDFDIDGYRADVAGMVPMDFWNEARNRLDEIKPVFMLAEDEGPKMHDKAFDMTYAWSYAHLIRVIAAGNEDLSALDSLMEVEETKFPDNAYRMYFTTNHDENSWNGTDPGMYGDNFENFAVLSATIDGMPLIYNGQESNLDKQLEFFTKDPIEWKEYEYQPFYTMLLSLKNENEALWNGEFGGDLTIYNSPENTYAYKREKGDDWVFVYLNFGGEAVNVPITDYALPEDASGYEIYSEQLPPEEQNYFEVAANSWLLIANE